MCLALVLALTPAAAAEAAKGGKGKSAAKSCAVKKAKKGKKAKKARKCAKKTTKKKAVAPQRAAAERECRSDRRVDGEGFATDFGTGKDAVAKCAAELLEQTAGEPPLEEENEPLDDEGLEGEEPIDALDGLEDPALDDTAPIEDEPIL
jgi:hypothetical protein